MTKELGKTLSPPKWWSSRVVKNLLRMNLPKGRPKGVARTPRAPLAMVVEVGPLTKTMG